MTTYKTNNIFQKITCKIILFEITTYKKGNNKKPLNLKLFSGFCFNNIFYYLRY